MLPTPEPLSENGIRAGILTGTEWLPGIHAFRHAFRAKPASDLERSLLNAESLHLSLLLLSSAVTEDIPHSPRWNESLSLPGLPGRGARNSLQKRPPYPRAPGIHSA